MRKIALIVLGGALGACEGEAPRLANDVAAILTGQWATAYNKAQPAVLADLYADDAFLHMPNSATLSSKAEIQSYWANDLAAGGLRTEIELHNGYLRDGLLYAEGDYRVVNADGEQIAAGDFGQLWAREGGAWKLTSDNWHARDVAATSVGAIQLADRLIARWTDAYNRGDAAVLAALYEKDAKLTMPEEAALDSRDEIEVFWRQDLGDARVTTELTLTDTYAAGGIAHLEGAYRVIDAAGKEVGGGEYLQLWVRGGNEWSIHREMWSSSFTPSE